MKQENNNTLQELCSLLLEVERLCKQYSHINHLEPVKRLKALAESNYQKADNILQERQDAVDND